MAKTELAFEPFLDRTIGCFMGAAIGDAMGGPVECQHYRRIAKVFPDFQDLLPYRKPPGLMDLHPGYALDDAPGSVTDDTFIRADLTRFVLETPPPFAAAAFAPWLLQNADFDNWWSVAVEVLKRIKEVRVRGERLEPTFHSVTIEDVTAWGYSNAYATTLEVWDLRLFASHGENPLAETLEQRSRVKYQLKWEEDHWVVLYRELVQTFD